MTSITESVSGLTTAMEPVSDLSVGLSGAATLTADSPFATLEEFLAQFGEKLSGALPFSTDQVLKPVTALGDMKGHLQAPPSGALDGFGIKMEQTGTGLAGDFPTAVAQTVTHLNDILDKVPSDPSALASLLLDQIVAVFGSLDGPEADQIKAWIASVESLKTQLEPVIVATQGAGDPVTVALDIVQKALKAVADIFGLSKLEELLAFFDRLLKEPLSADLLTSVDGALTSFGSSLDAVKTAAAGDVAELRTVALAAAEELRRFRELLRPGMDVLLQIATAPLLQPGALAQELGRLIDDALATQVQDVAKIDDPYKALLDRIDAAIAGIDLGSVRTSVLDGLHAVRDAIAGANLEQAGETLQSALVPVQAQVDALQQGATDLLNEVKGALDDATAQIHGLAEQIGTFAPDGTFTFNVAGEVHDALTTVRDFVTGDVTDALNTFKTAIDGFLDELTQLLKPVEQAVAGAATGAQTAIEDFASFVEGLDVPELLAALKDKVDEIVKALTPIDFKQLVDPVVDGLNESADKIKGIDTSKLNALLKEALGAALDLIVGIDFTATIADPLHEEMAKAKKVPDEIVGELQEKYEQALSVLDGLRPSELLKALFAAFDTIEAAVSGLDAATLLAPLDALHQQHLHQPVAELKPEALLKPLQDAFDDLTAAVGQLKGAVILKPVQDGLDQLKAKVAALDLTGPIDDLRGLLAKLVDQLQALEPSKLIAPVVDDLTKLEAKLDDFKPSVVFEPVVALAGPLLELVEHFEAEAVTKLHDLFQAPLAALERLRPEKLQAELQGAIQAVIDAIESLKLPARYQALRSTHLQIKATASAAGGSLRADLVLLVDVEVELKGFLTAHDLLIQALTTIKNALTLDPLKAAYDTLEQRLLDLLPPYAKAVLDPAAFKTLMEMASPLRFLDELDARFEAIKQKLIPISPQEIAAELDAAHAEVMQQVANLGLDDRLVQIKGMIEQIQGIVTNLRIDFVADELDRALGDVRAVVAGLDPAQIAPDLDGLHADVLGVVDQAKPSLILHDLDEPLDALKAVVGAVDPREQLGKPLDEAWKAVDAQLQQVDLAEVLTPVGARLDELEKDFDTQLKRAETAFDDMLKAAKAVL
jgi:hypothetical protein